MPSLNRVEIIGHVGREPEMKYTPSGSGVCKFSVATSEKWTDKASGDKKERTEWHGVQAWGKLAEVCGKYVVKGMLVYVSGNLRTNEWEDKEGVKRSRTEINADSVLFLSKAALEPPYAGEQAMKPGKKRLPEIPGEDIGDDIPF